MGCSERQKEIRRRRHRQKKYAKIQQRLPKAGSGEKVAIAKKLRSLTPGAEEMIEKLGLEG